MLRRLFTSSRLYFKDLPLLLIRQAMTIVADLDTPAAQWTKTFQAASLAAQMKWKVGSKCGLMDQTVESWIQSYKYWSQPLKCDSNPAPALTTLFILSWANSYLSAEQSSLPRYSPYSIRSTDGLGFALFLYSLKVLFRESQQLWHNGNYVRIFGSA